MPTRKGNKMLQVSVHEEVIESMDKVCKAISNNTKKPYTKGMLITDIYIQWLEYQNREIEKAEKEEKENA